MSHPAALMTTAPILPCPPPFTGLEISSYPNYQSARMESNGRRNRVVGSFTSLKTGIRAPWESHNERLGIEFAEVDPNVITYRTQPFILRGKVDGRAWSYTPDRFERRSDGKAYVIEVKQSAEELKRRDLSEKLNLAAAAVKAWGAEFEIQLGEALKSHQYSNFVRSVIYYRRTQITHSDWLTLDTLSDRSGKLSYGDLVTAYPTAAMAFAKFASLLVRGFLTMDRLEPVTEATSLRRTVREAS